MHRGKVLELVADVMIISEQYSKKLSGKLFDDNTGTAAIWIPSRSNLTPTKKEKKTFFMEWGMITTKSRGRRVVEMAARKGLLVANVGTFKRPG